ncbi:MAG: hypothetical protein IJU31_06365, partial [Synergistaceae bacterium]|nr:hypothetical protein [Synergistaceae bacterium]
MPDEKLSTEEFEDVQTETLDEDPFSVDEIWKDFIREFWREILERFLPNLYRKVDLTREPEFLDK